MSEKKLKLKNYIGYALCDTGNTLGFSVVSNYLSAFYIDIAKLSGTAAWAIMLIARIWDAINDPMMGSIAQRRKPTKHGKYRYYLVLAGIPYAIFSILAFTNISSAPYNLRIIWCIFTYIMCGMLYTVVIVPYGSLASVMTRDTIERSNLSIARSIGGGVGGAPCGMLFPMLVFTNNVLDGSKLVKTMCVVAVIMMALYCLGFSLTKENVPSAENPEKVKIFDTVRSLIKNRPFVLVSIIGCLLISSSMYLGTSSVFVFKDYFHRTGFIMTIYTIISYAPMALMIPFTGLIIKRIGKKEFSVIGLAISAASSFILCIWQVTNPWIYIIFAAFINLGVGFVTLEIWAFACDVIDIQELNTKKREEAASYACFTFMRKIGQAIAACVPLLLELIGYNKETVGNQLPEVCDGIYRVATIGPAIMFAVMLVCFILYPISKEKASDISLQLAQLREITDKAE